MPPLAQMCGVMLSGSEEATPSTVYHCVLRGLERLLLSEQLSRLDAESLVKLSVDRVNVHSPHRAMAALGLMLTCMYTGEGVGPTSVWAAHESPVAALWASGPEVLEGSPPRAACPVMLPCGRHAHLGTRAPCRARPASQVHSSAALFQGRRKPVPAEPLSPALPRPTASP